MSAYACSWCAKAVPLPPRGWTVDQPLYCEDHQRIRGRDPNIVMPAALEGATEHLRTDLTRVPRWPWLSLDGMAGLWCASLGFSERRLADAAARQMQPLPY